MLRILTFDLAGEMDLFFVRKLSLRKLEYINQIGEEEGSSVRQKHIIFNLSHDPYPSRGLMLCFDAQLLPQMALQGTEVHLLNHNIVCH